MKILKWPNWEELPSSYRWFMLNWVKEVNPWNLYSYKEQKNALGIRMEFILETSSPNDTPYKDFMPFAEYMWHDNYAWFIIENWKITEKIIDVHLTFRWDTEYDWYPTYDIYNNFWEWLELWAFGDSVLEEEIFEYKLKELFLNELNTYTEYNDIYKFMEFLKNNLNSEEHKSIFIKILTNIHSDLEWIKEEILWQILDYMKWFHWIHIEQTKESDFIFYLNSLWKNMK